MESVVFQADPQQETAKTIRSMALQTVASRDIGKSEVHLHNLRLPLVETNALITKVCLSDRRRVNVIRKANKEANRPAIRNTFRDIYAWRVEQMDNFPPKCRECLLDKGFTSYYSQNVLLHILSHFQCQERSY